MLRGWNIPLALVAILLLVLAACAPSAAQPTVAPAAPAAAPKAPAQPAAPALPTTPTPVVIGIVTGATPTPRAVRPTYGGILTMQQMGGTEFLFDGPLSSPHSVGVDSPNWNGLLELVDSSRKPTPSLAERWETPDGKKYTFYLRKDVVWNDGTPFTSADVVATYDLMMYRLASGADAGSRISPYLRDLATPDTKVTWRAVDPYTVEFLLPNPTANFIDMISTKTRAEIVPKHIVDKYSAVNPKYPLREAFAATKKVVGTGPFILDSFMERIEYTYKRNPKYFKKDEFGNQLPYLDGLKIIVIRDNSLRLAAFRTGQVLLWPSGYPPISKAEADMLKASLRDKVVVIPGNALGHETLDYNLTRPYFKEVDFRWAINLILDRFDIGERAAEGNFLAGAILDPGLHGDAALPLEELYTYPGLRRDKTQDFADARKILSEKYGITPQKPSPEFIVSSRNTGLPPAIVQVAVQQLAPFGIRFRLEIKDQTASSLDLTSGEFDINPDYDSVPNLDPYQAISINWDSLKLANPVFKWKGPAQDQVMAGLKEALRTLDPDKRNEVYHKLQRFLLSGEQRDQLIADIGWEMTYYMWWSKVNYTLIGGAEGSRHDTTWISK